MSNIITIGSSSGIKANSEPSGVVNSQHESADERGRIQNRSTARRRRRRLKNRLKETGAGKESDGEHDKKGESPQMNSETGLNTPSPSMYYDVTMSGEETEEETEICLMDVQDPLDDGSGVNTVSATSFVLDDDFFGFPEDPASQFNNVFDFSSYLLPFECPDPSTSPILPPPSLASASFNSAMYSPPPRIRRQPLRRTEAHVVSACCNCSKVKLRCDGQRPCARCVASGQSDSCRDVKHKKRVGLRLHDDREFKRRGPVPAQLKPSPAPPSQQGIARIYSQDSQSAVLPGSERKKTVGSRFSSNYISKTFEHPQSHDRGFLNEAAGEHLDVGERQTTWKGVEKYQDHNHGLEGWIPGPLSELEEPTPYLKDPISERDSGARSRASDTSTSACATLSPIRPRSHTPEQGAYSNKSTSAHLFPTYRDLDNTDWKDLQMQLPESWMWDVDYHSTSTSTYVPGLYGCWTCTPLEADTPKSFPLTIAGRPVVLPVEYTWPPLAGVNPPPDPRSSALIDCTAEVPLEMIRDLFLMFTGSLGFYLLVNGVLQIIVEDNFDKEWAASHLPHKYGGLKVCYIAKSMEPTMFPSSATPASNTNTIESKHLQTPTAPSSSLGRSSSNFFRLSSSRLSTGLLAPSLQLNDFIEARTRSSHKKEKFAGRIGAKVVKNGEPYLVMSSHVVTEAILDRSHRAAIFGRNKDRFERLDGDWNEHVEIWAGNEKIGTIEKSFDPEAEIYPNGFMHDVCLIKPANPSSVKNIQSPIPNLGWQSRESWNSLRQQSTTVRILGGTEDHRAAKTLKTNRPSEVLVVGEGIFLNQTASPRPIKDHDISTWKDLVSRALLYRVYPDFDPPNGHSGIAIYADGPRDDGTTGPGIVGFQSFVQQSGHVQNFEMEGGPLEKRLKLGRVAFYGAFQVPDVLRREYGVV